MTTLRCPGCGGEMSIDILLSHNALRQAIVDLVEKGLSLGSLVMRYVGLFRPATNRMSPDRFCKLIEQLLPDVERNAITFKGREWSIPRAVWEQGFEAMLEKAGAKKLTLPLENHNYLYSVLVGIADKAEAVEETASEQERRHVRAPLTTAGPVSLAAIVSKAGVPEHIRAELDAVRSGVPLAQVRGGADA